MKATIITTEDLRNCDERNYNPQIWERNINSMTANYKDVVFYHVPRCGVYDYDRYFVEYTLPEGLRLFDSFGYSSSLTNGGFYRLDKTPISSDGRTYRDMFDLVNAGITEGITELHAELESTDTFEITYGKFSDGSGAAVLFGTSKEARREMTSRSIEYGMTFAKG
jgi:hypothetical protein